MQDAGLDGGASVDADIDAGRDGAGAGFDAGVDAGCPEGAACAGGVCRLEACCTGCWDGVACRTGDELAACGAGGGACLGCDDAHACSDDSCVAGACVNAPRADGEACGVGRECWSDACSFVFRDPVGGRRAGGHVSLGPDATGDGVPDVAVSWAAVTPWDVPPPVVESVVELRSGADGALVWSVTVDEMEVDGAGVNVSLGPDADGDGLGDVLTSGRVSPTGSATLFAGTDGTVIRTWVGDASRLVGHESMLVDDYDGDGLADPMFTVRRIPLPYDTDWVLEVRSGVTDSLIRIFGPFFLSSREQVRAGADADGDGLTDVIVAVPLHMGPFAASVLSGASGEPLGRRFWDVGAEPVANVPDIDGDGLGEAVLTMSTDLVAAAVMTPTEHWRVAVDAVRTIDAGPDADGDAVADLALTYWGVLSRLDLRSGATGAVFRTWHDQILTASLGPDVDADGRADLAYYDSTALLFVLSPSREW